MGLRRRAAYAEQSEVNQHNPLVDTEKSSFTVGGYTQPIVYPHLPVRTASRKLELSMLADLTLEPFKRYNPDDNRYKHEINMFDFARQDELSL